MGRVIAAFSQFFDGEGAPLARGWLRFTENLTNNTDKDTFFDPIYQIPNENPLQLDAEGRCGNVFGTGLYRVVLFENDPEDEDSPGEQVQLFDNVQAEAAASTGGGGAGFADWDNTVEYDLYDIVIYNTIYYRSLQAENLNNNPAIEESYWEAIDFLHYYNSTITYSAGDLIQYNYNLYLSKQSLNSGNDPESSPAWWRPVATGYQDIFLKTTDYEILPTEPDSIFVLSSSAVADSQFDLPALDATYDRFKTAVYNASDYELTISALSGSIWIDSTSELIIEKGAFCEFRYSSDLDQWMPCNNAGQALGGQTLGTATLPVALIHADTVNLTTANIATANITTAHFPSDEFCYFGDADDSAIGYNSGDTSLDIDGPASGRIDLLIDGVRLWSIDASGALLAGPASPLKNIGAAADRINYVYPTNISLPDSGVCYFGTDNDAYLYHNGSNAYLNSATGQLYISTSSASSLVFQTNATNALILDTAQNAAFYGVQISILGSTQSLRLGSTNLAITHDTANAFIDTVAGNLYFRMTGSYSTAMMIDTSLNVNFYGNTSIGTNKYHYMGNSNNASIGFPGFLQIGTAATNIYFFTNGAYRWFIDTAGHLYPYTDITYNIGSPSIRVANIYTANLVTAAATITSLTAPTINATTITAPTINATSVLNTPSVVNSGNLSLGFNGDTVTLINTQSANPTHITITANGVTRYIYLYAATP